MSFNNQVNEMAKHAASEFLKRNIAPATSIAKIAEQHKLSATQIDRVVNKTNRKIIINLQKNAAKENPHFTFPVAKTAEVIGLIKTPAKGKAKEIEKVIPKVASHSDYIQKRNVIRDMQLEKQANVSKTREREFAKARVSRCYVELEKMASLAFMGYPKNVVESVKEKFDSEAVHEAIDNAHEKVAMRAPIYETKVAFEINDDHPLLKKASELNELEKAYDECCR